MEKLTIAEFKNRLEEMESTNALYKWVIEDIMEDSEGYDGNLLEKLKSRTDDVSHGCQTGVVGSLIYYADTAKFFKQFRVEINDMLKEEADALGENPINYMKDFDMDDILCCEIGNQNLLAWYAYETVNYQLQGLLEDIQLEDVSE